MPITTQSAAVCHTDLTCVKSRRYEFLDETENIVLIDGPSTGKTHIAIAIRGKGRQAGLVSLLLETRKNFGR